MTALPNTITAFQMTDRADGVIERVWELTDRAGDGEAPLYRAPKLDGARYDYAYADNLITDRQVVLEQCIAAKREEVGFCAKALENTAAELAALEAELEDGTDGASMEYGVHVEPEILTTANRDSFPETITAYQPDYHAERVVERVWTWDAENVEGEEPLYTAEPYKGLNNVTDFRPARELITDRSIAVAQALRKQRMKLEQGERARNTAARVMAQLAQDI